MYNTMGLSFETRKARKITEVPTLCPVLDILSYGEGKAAQVSHQDEFPVWNFVNNVSSKNMCGCTCLDMKQWSIAIVIFKTPIVDR